MPQDLKSGWTGLKSGLDSRTGVQTDFVLK